MVLSYPYSATDGSIVLPWASMHTFLVGMQADGITIAKGTCMAVSRHDRWFIVTNRHNVTGLNQHDESHLDPWDRIPDQLAIYLPTENLSNEWWVHGIALRDDEGRPTWTEHPIFGRQVDVVAIPFERPEQAKIFGITLDDHDDFAVEIGDEVHTIGYRGAQPEFSAFPHWIPCLLETPLTSSWNDLPAFKIRGAFSKGSSGSPVIAYREGAENLSRSDGSLIGANWTSRFLGLYSGRVSDGSGLVWNTACVRHIVDYSADKIEREMGGQAAGK